MKPDTDFEGRQTRLTMRHLIGFLSQKDGGELGILNAAGEVIVTRRYEAVIPMSGAVGGLHGPSNLETGSAILLIITA